MSKKYRPTNNELRLRLKLDCAEHIIQLLRLKILEANMYKCLIDSAGFFKRLKYLFTGKF